MPITTRKPKSWFKDSEQIRKDLGNEADLRNLGESLRVRQLAPVGAMSDGQPIYGFRRLKAAWLVGLPDIAVTIYDEPLSEAEITIIQLTENIHRLDMSAFEKWNAYEELRRLNPRWSAKELAEHLKLEPSAVSKWLSVSKCIPDWQEALKAGRVGITDCYSASQVSEDQQRELLAMKLAGASRDALTRAVKRTKPTLSDADSIRSTRITIPLPSGAKIVVSGKDQSFAELVETLIECLEAARKGLKERIDLKTWQSVMRDKSLAPTQGDDHV